MIRRLTKKKKETPTGRRLSLLTGNAQVGHVLLYIPTFLESHWPLRMEDSYWKIIECAFFWRSSMSALFDKPDEPALIQWGCSSRETLPTAAETITTVAAVWSSRYSSVTEQWSRIAIEAAVSAFFWRSALSCDCYRAPPANSNHRRPQNHH